MRAATPPSGDGSIGDPSFILKLANTEAEQALLGALLINNAAFEHVVDLIKPEDFVNGMHGRVFRVIGELVGRGGIANPVTLLHHFAQEEAIEKVGGAEYLVRLAASAVTTVNAPFYARTIADLARRRDVVAAAQDTILDATSLEDAGRTVVDVIDAGEERLFRIAESTASSAIEPVGDLAAGVIRNTEAAYKAGGIRVVNTGISDLDRQLSGLDAGALVVVGGRPSMGKTALATTIAINVAKTPPDAHDPPTVRRLPGKVVLIFSLEMTKAQLTQRWLAGLTGIETEDQRHGRLKPEDWPRLIEAHQYLSALPIYVDDQARLSVPQMRQRARRLKRRIGRLDLIVVDHLQHIRQGGRVENRRLEIGDATGMLKAIAKELDVPVLLLSQLSRAVEQRDDKRPMLADLRECVTGDTLVNLADGRRVPIADLVGEAPQVLSVSAGRVISATASKVWPVGERDVWSIRLASGRTVTATDKHRLYGYAGWARVADLSVGDRLAISRHLPEPAEPAAWPDEHCVLLAHLIGDGSYLSNRPLRYTTASVHCSEAVRAAAEYFGCKVNRHEGRGNWHQLVISRNGNRWHPAGVNKWLRELGVFGQHSHDKRIPAPVFTLRNEQIALFLRHLWATDGHISGGNADKKMGPSAYFSTCGRGLAFDVAALLSRFGIVSRILKVHAVYGVWIRGVENLTLFLDKVGAFGPRVIQAEALRARLAGRKSNTNVDTLPIEIFETVKAQMRARGISQRTMAAMRGTSYGGDAHFGFAPSRETVKSYAEILDNDDLRAAASDDLFWDTIVSIEPSGRQPVYDLTVPGPHSWLADGIVSHNSGDIEQDSDVVMFLYREEYYLARSAPKRRPGMTGDAWAAAQADHEDEIARARGLAEVIVAKNRTGRAGLTVKLAWDGARQRFADLARP